jgi:hypothetical protein
LLEETAMDRARIIESRMRKQAVGCGYVCLLCGFSSTGRKNVFCHVESKHFQSSAVPYECSFCPKVMYSKNSHDTHVSRYHKEERSQMGGKY